MYLAVSAMLELSELSEEKPRLRPVCFVIARLISLNLVPAARLVGPASPSGVAPLLSSNGLPEWLILAPSCLFPANGGRCWAFAPASRLPPDTLDKAQPPLLCHLLQSYLTSHSSSSRQTNLLLCNINSPPSSPTPRHLPSSDSHHPSIKSTTRNCPQQADHHADLCQDP